MNNPPVFVFWNYMSASMPQHGIEDILKKIREQTYPVLRVWMYCNVRATDEMLLSLVHRQHDFVVGHIRATDSAKTIGADIIRQTRTCTVEPGWVVLVSALDDYATPLATVARDGWKILIVHMPSSNLSLLDYADASFTFSECHQLELMPPTLLTRCFLIQAVTASDLSNFLTREQECLYFNPANKEAVIAIEADTEELVLHSLEQFILRVRSNTRIKSNDPEPNLQTLRSRQRRVPIEQNVLAEVEHFPFKASPVCNFEYAADAHESDSCNYDAEHQHLTEYQELDAEPVSSNACRITGGHRNPFLDTPQVGPSTRTLSRPQKNGFVSVSACNGFSETGGSRKAEKNPFGADPWKKAEERFKQRHSRYQHSHKPRALTVRDCCRLDELEQFDSEPPAVMNNRSDYCWLDEVEVRRGGGGGGGNASSRRHERFRKPAPQCVHWENRRHRQETGCTLWHPRETCRFFPSCAHEAEQCGFGHPFCGPKCLCDPAALDPQLNHWTEELQQSFGSPSPDASQHEP